MKRRRILTTLLILTFAVINLHFLPLDSVIRIPAEAKIQSKISSAIYAAASSNNGKANVIVVTKSRPSTDLKNQLTGAGGRVKREFRLFNGLACELPLQAMEGLARRQDVRSIQPDSKTYPLMDIATGATGADVAWQNYGLDGSGIGVAVIDSGITYSEDFSGQAGQSRIVYSQSFVDGDSTTSDKYGHGTHVAGIIAGNGSAASGGIRSMQGMAPKANLINLRVLDQNGGGSMSSVISAIETAITLKSVYNIRVINLSLGAPVLTSYHEDPLCMAADMAWDNGIVVVVAAGNLGNTSYGPYGLVLSPGNSPNVLTVGATNSWGTVPLLDDTIASYSSRGPTFIDNIIKPDIVAPGNKIKSVLAANSTLANWFPQNRVDPSYYYLNPLGKPYKYLTLSGTSMATPVVSGAVALMLQKEPTLNNHTVKLRLMASANKSLLQVYDIFTVGAGMLNVPGALNQTGIAGSSKSPYAEREPDTPAVRLVIDAPWGSQSVFGTSVVWGNFTGSAPNPLPPTNPGFTEAIVNGSSVVWGNSIVWGNNSVFQTDSANASSVLEAQSIVTGKGE